MKYFYSLIFTLIIFHAPLKARELINPAMYQLLISNDNLCLQKKEEKLVGKPCSTSYKSQQILKASNPTGDTTLKIRSKCLTAVDNKKVKLKTCDGSKPNKQLWKIRSDDNNHRVWISSKAGEKRCIQSQLSSRTFADIKLKPCGGPVPNSQKFIPFHPPER